MNSSTAFRLSLSLLFHTPTYVQYTQITHPNSLVFKLILEFTPRNHNKGSSFDNILQIHCQITTSLVVLVSGNDFDLHANVKVDFQFFNSPHLTEGGREKHLWMLGV